MKRIIPLAQLLTFKSVYREDSDWEALLEEFRANPAHWRTVQQLATELKGGRFFREPVYVGKDAEYDPDSFWVFDGTHRTCAYLLAEVDEVEVLFEEDDVEAFPASPRWMVETRIIGADGYMMNYEGDGELPSLYDALMSLRVDSKVWLTSDISAGDREGLSVFWDRGAAEVSPEVINGLAIAQLRTFGLDMAKLSVHTVRLASDWEESA